MVFGQGKSFSYRHQHEYFPWRLLFGFCGAVRRSCWTGNCNCVIISPVGLDLASVCSLVVEMSMVCGLSSGYSTSPCDWQFHGCRAHRNHILDGGVFKLVIMIVL